MKHKIITLIVFGLSFFSCENDLPLKIDKISEKLTINALLDANVEKNTIWLSLTSRAVTDTVEQAIIRIYINNELKEEITQPDTTKKNRIYGYTDDIATAYLTTVRLFPGDNVKIDASANDGKYNAWAEVIVPHLVSIESIDTLSYYDQFSNYYGDRSIHKLLRLKIKFVDPPNEENFYRIWAKKTDTIRYMDIERDTISEYTDEENLFMVMKDDIVLTDGYPPLMEDNSVVNQHENRCAVFDDTHFNGTTYILTTGILSSGRGYGYSSNNYVNDDNEYSPRVELLSREIEIELQSISKAEFHYLKALNIFYSDNYDEKYSQPIKFPTNVKDGNGFFGVRSVSKVVLNLVGE